MPQANRKRVINVSSEDNFGGQGGPGGPEGAAKWGITRTASAAPGWHTCPRSCPRIVR